MPDRRIFIPAALAVMVWSGVAVSSAGPSPYLAVIEKVSGAVSFYAVSFYTEEGRLLGEVRVGSFPHEAVLAPDGRLYVSDNGVLWMTEDKEGTNTISVVDVHSMKKVDEIDLGRFHRPHGIAMVPGSKHLLATTERPAGLIEIDPVARTVVRDFDVKGKSPHMVIPMAGGKSAYVSNTDSDAVAAIDLGTGAVRLIPTGARPQGAVLSPGADRLYVVNTSGNQISVIDTRKQTVERVIPTGKGPGRIAITPDGKTLVYNLQFEPGVGFADVASGKQTGMVALSGRPLSLTMTRDGKRAFAGIQDQDKVCFLSVADRKIERTIELPKGSGPDPAIPLEGR